MKVDFTPLGDNVEYADGDWVVAILSFFVDKSRVDFPSLFSSHVSDVTVTDFSVDEFSSADGKSWAFMTVQIRGCFGSVHDFAGSIVSRDGVQDSTFGILVCGRFDEHCVVDATPNTEPVVNVDNPFLDALFGAIADSDE